MIEFFAFITHDVWTFSGVTVFTFLTIAAVGFSIHAILMGWRGQKLEG
ncbi:hypothetical protein HC752_21975 [Vibrio sp. S9_S30]|nr:hypothetical protein [Vibrio sp. S9_S30]MBD1559616.1 hypothetical protein [Vibrio sp. S9_S30]